MPLTLEELAIHVPGAIAVFEEYNLDYYQDGSRTLRAACADKGVPFGEVDLRLSQLNTTSDLILPLTLADMSADRLIDFINGRFHNSEEEMLELIHRKLLMPGYTIKERKILLRTEPLFAELKAHLLSHCHKEDKLLFPWMRRLVTLHKTRSLKKNRQMATLISNPLLLLKEEHRVIMTLFRKIREAAVNFYVAEKSSEPYRLLMQHFRDFEADLHMHLHIENNILFPRLMAMEDSLTQH